MSDKGLRAKVIRLAHAKPELRENLLPLLKEAHSRDSDVLGQVKRSMNNWLELATKKYDGERSKRDPHAEIYRNTVQGRLYRLGNWYWQESDDPDFFDDYDLEEGNHQYLMEPQDERRIEKHFKDFMGRERWYVKGKFRIEMEAQDGGQIVFHVALR